MRLFLIAALAMMAFTSDASAQGLIRQNIDNALNSVESMLGNETPEHRMRSLQDLIELRDEEIKRLLGAIEARRQEREAAAQELATFGVVPPEPVLRAPITVPGLEGQPSQTCLLSFGGKPLACW